MAGSEDRPAPSNPGTPSFIAGMRYVVRVEARLPVRIPLRFAAAKGLAGQREGLRYLQRRTVRVNLNGAPVAAGLMVDPAGQLELVFKAPHGEHQLVVASAPAGASPEAGPEEQLVLISRRIVVPANGRPVGGPDL